MNIVRYELKKIWRPLNVITVAVLCSLFYYLFISFDIEYFPNGHPSTEDIALSKELLLRYGPVPEEKQLHDFIVEKRNQYVIEAEEYISTNPAFAKVGIFNYADYLTVREQEEQAMHSQIQVDQAVSDTARILFSAEANYIGFNLQSLNSLEENYNGYLRYNLSYMKEEMVKTDYEQSRIDQIRETGEYRSLMSYWVYSNTARVMINFSLLVILAVMVLVSPLLVNDHSSHLRFLQYSSQLGRKLIRHQFMAIMLSALILTTVLLILMGIIYSSNETWVFWNTGMSSFLNVGFFYLLPLTYGKYILTYIAMIYLLSLGTSTIAFMLSRYSQNPITLIMKLIPAYGIMALLSYSLVNFLFMSYNHWYTWIRIVGIEFLVAIIFFAIGCLLASWIMRHERQVEMI